MKKYSSITKAKSRRNFSTKRTRLAVVLLMGALLLGWLLPAATTMVGSFLVQPVLVLERWMRTSEHVIPTYVRTRSALQAELDALTEEIALQEIHTAEYAAVLAENETLRQLADAGATSTDIVANILAQPPFVPYDRLVINQGSRSGVVVGAPVLVGERVAVGTVIRTTPWQSVVELISSPGAETTVFVFGPNIYATAVGQGNGVLEIGVPQGIAIAVGDAVTLPAGSATVIGAVRHIETASSRPEQFAYVTLPVPLQSIQTVAVTRQPLVPLSFESARERVDTTRETLFSVPVPEGVLVEIPETATSTASSTATSTSDTETQ